MVSEESFKVLLKTVTEQSRYLENAYGPSLMYTYSHLTLHFISNERKLDDYGCAFSYSFSSFTTSNVHTYKLGTVMILTP